MIKQFINFGLRLAYRVAYPIVKTLRRWLKIRDDGVTIAVWYQDSILMVRHSYRPGLLLPGGGVKSGEDPKLCAAREIFEECGIRINPDQLVLVDVRKRLKGIGEILLYEVVIEKLPVITIDHREIIYAGFVARNAIDLNIKDTMMRDYLRNKVHYPLVLP